MVQRTKCFLLMLCYLSFSLVSDISVVLDIFRSFSSIRVIISSLLVMTGHVREIRHMYQFAVTTSEDFL